MPEEIDRAMFRALLQASLPIDDIQSVSGLGKPLNRAILIWIDDQDRPDFRTTIMAHQDPHHPGSFRFAWLYKEMSRKTRLLLRIEMEKPTRSVFHLNFSLAKDFGILLAIAQSRLFWLVPGPAIPLPASKMVIDANAFYETYKQQLSWLLVIELSEVQANELLEFLANWPYQPGC